MMPFDWEDSRRYGVTLAMHGVVYQWPSKVGEHLTYTPQGALPLCLAYLPLVIVLVFKLVLSD